MTSELRSGWHTGESPTAQVVQDGIPRTGIQPFSDRQYIGPEAISSLSPARPLSEVVQMRSATFFTSILTVPPLVVAAFALTGARTEPTVERVDFGKTITATQPVY